MKRFEYKADILDAWQRHPLRLVGPRISRCHRAPTYLVMSMRGGFVSANCSKCNNSETFSDEDWSGLEIHVACPKCPREMRKALGDSLKEIKNFAFVCEPCGIYIHFADLLPLWNSIACPE